MKYMMLLLFSFLLGCNERGKDGSARDLERENDLLKNEIELLKENQNNRNSDRRFQYKTYYNTDRQFKIDYPSFLTMGAAPQNGDGREFISDGGEIRLWVHSSYYTDEPLAAQYNQELNDQSVTITYKVLRDNWYVISGIDNDTDKLFYKKVYYSRNVDQIRTMYLSYPQTKQNEFDIIIPHLIKTFKDI